MSMDGATPGTRVIYGGRLVSAQPEEGTAVPRKMADDTARKPVRLAKPPLKLIRAMFDDLSRWHDPDHPEDARLVLQWRHYGADVATVKTWAMQLLEKAKITGTDQAIQHDPSYSDILLVSLPLKLFEGHRSDMKHVLSAASRCKGGDQHDQAAARE